MDQTNTTQTDGGILSWLRSNWTYVAGAVAVTAVGYGAYRYFGAEEVAEAASELDRAVGE